MELVEVEDLCVQDFLSSNWELLNLVLPRSEFEQEIIWLVSNFVSLSEVQLEKLFLKKTFNYKMDKEYSGARFGHTTGFN